MAFLAVFTEPQKGIPPSTKRPIFVCVRAFLRRSCGAGDPDVEKHLGAVSSLGTGTWVAGSIWASGQHLQAAAGAAGREDWPQLVTSGLRPSLPLPWGSLISGGSKMRYPPK